MVFPSGFSRFIDIGKLERQSRKLLAAGFAFAVLFHCLIGVFFALHKPETVTRAVQKAERRIVTDLIPIPPRAENPYDTWRGPELIRRLGPKAFQPRIPNIPGGMPFKPFPKFGDGAFRFRGDEYGIDTDALIRAIVESGSLTPRRPVKEPEPYRPEPYRLFAPKRNYWDNPNRVSMRDEMLRIEDLNTGTHKGLVVLNLANERDIKGYLYLPTAVRGDSLAPPSSTLRSVAGLAEVLKKHTGIIAFAEKQVELSSPDILKYPFLYIAADAAFDVSEIERMNLGNYLKNGGFAFIEAYGAGDSGLPPRAAGSIREMLGRALGAEGALRIIPNDHALYRCYFEFSDGPPHTQRENATVPSGQPAASLEGIFVGDRLAAVYSEKGYGAAWSNPKGGGAFQNMGVNLVVFALTQAGGITVRFVDDSGS